MCLNWVVLFPCDDTLYMLEGLNVLTTFGRIHGKDWSIKYVAIAVASAPAVRYKLVIILLFIFRCCFHNMRKNCVIGSGIVMQSFLVWQPSRRGREMWLLCLNCILHLFVRLCTLMFLSHCVIGWSVLCEC